jgi:sulfur-oxidizing protein SoxY
MTLDRRQALALLPGAAVLAATGGRFAVAAGIEAEAAVAAFAGGRTPLAGRIVLTVPDIAENGASVPVAFAVDSPMTDADHVEAVLLVAPGNPTPGVATFRFAPLAGRAEAATRIRLARTQEIVAVARMGDGSVFADRREIKVTIGGCGG